VASSTLAYLLTEYYICVACCWAAEVVIRERGVVGYVLLSCIYRFPSLRGVSIGYILAGKQEILPVSVCSAVINKGQG
jgi:hypothetical protein